MWSRLTLIGSGVGGVRVDLLAADAALPTVAGEDLAAVKLLGAHLRFACPPASIRLALGRLVPDTQVSPL